MNRVKNINKSALSEILFQIILHVIVFLFYSFDREAPHFESYKLVFFLNYSVAVFIINYALLPQFLYKKKYAMFVVLLMLVVLLTILIEEYVLEKIYFPDTRGQTFQGFFYVLLDIMPVIAILSGYKFAWDLIRKQREVEELRASVEKSELNFLKSQINPHFLFNNLNNLYAYALEKSDKTPLIILELSSVLRYMLYDCREEYVSLETELQQLQNFVRLNELQIEERGKVTFIPPERSAKGYKVAPLILMNFVENAFKHSIGSQVDNIVIRIKLEIQENGILVFECENTYHSNTNNSNLSEGIGLNNVRKRLELIYPNSHILKISEQEGWFNVFLSLNLK
jgi:hypothetical protein